MPYCDEIMRCLLELLQSSTINRSVKPCVISIFADLALSIEGEFNRYTSIVLGILQQAGEVNIGQDADEDMVEYINSLRVAILEAYTGIIQGLLEAKQQDLVLPGNHPYPIPTPNSTTTSNPSHLSPIYLTYLQHSP